jgi:hypothetical protein
MPQRVGLDVFTSTNLPEENPEYSTFFLRVKENIQGRKLASAA